MSNGVHVIISETRPWLPVGLHRIDQLKNTDDLTCRTDQWSAKHGLCPVASTFIKCSIEGEGLVWIDVIDIIDIHQFPRLGNPPDQTGCINGNVHR